MASTNHPELLTLRDWLRYAVSQFNGANLQYGQGSDNAWDEAVYLLLHSLQLPLDTLEPFLDARLLPDERQRCREIINQRCVERLPAAYITGEAWLQGCRFKVNRSVIIPRSPISELLADQLLPWIAHPERINTALDMCTGSGCLAILTALAFPDAQVDAVDISPDALEVASTNVRDYGLEQRLTLYQSDLFDDLAPRRYDLIICNPPYVNQTSMQALPQEFQYEPTMALAGGDNGMDYVKRILAAAPHYLSNQGVLLLEIGHEAAHFSNEFPDLSPLWINTANTEDCLLLLTRDQLLDQA